MTFINCPHCSLANYLTDVKCSRCDFVFQTENSSAIQKPFKPLPESSFADLSEPDSDSGILPSHSRTPQLIAKVATKQQLRKESQEFNYNQSPKKESYFPSPVQLPETSVKTDIRQPQVIAAKSDYKLLFAVLAACILALFSMVILAGIWFLNR